MATVTEAGNMKIVSGTLAEIADAIKGYPPQAIRGFTHDGTNFVVILARKD